MVLQQRNNNKAFPNNFIDIIDDKTDTYASFVLCHNCKMYNNSATAHLKLKNHMINTHGYAVMP